MACETLCRNLMFHHFQQAHWKQLPMSNVINKALREVRPRKRVVGRFPNELSALTFASATLEQIRPN